MPKKQAEHIWLALSIGNSRLHWAWFVGETFGGAWDTEYLSVQAVEQMSQSWGKGTFPREFLPPSLIGELDALEKTIGEGFPNRDRPLPLYLASVVPSQTAIWQNYPNLNVISLDLIPLQDTYPTLGVDRALAVLGGGETWGWPILVIDAGTALTFTGADGDRKLIGGAILPGISLQFKSLAQGTAALPKISLPSQLPPRYATDTSSAIQSGVIYTILAGVADFIQAWWQEFPDSKIVFAGGDRTVLFTYLQSLFPEVATKVKLDPHLIFWGMRSSIIQSF